MQNQYIETKSLCQIIQDLPLSQNDNAVNIIIVRASDGYYWDFTQHLFVSSANSNTTGIMSCITGTFWTSSFTPDRDDIYLISIDNTTIDSQASQTLKAVTSVTPTPTAPTIPSGSQSLIDTAKQFMPARFISQVDDNRIMAFLELVLADINATSPATSYTLDSMPVGWRYITCFGAQLYGTLFLIANYTLQDFSYSDNGLSLSVDRTSKLTPVYDKALANYGIMKQNLKKAAALSVGAKALATNTYFSVVAQFLSSVFPGTIAH